METRKITIVSTKSQKNSVIESAATTLGELKEDLRKNNIDYEGMTFYEGLSKCELNDDEAILPHDIMYKGKTTNNLAFMLTNPNKKIKSGAYSRSEICEFFKNHRDKAEEVKERYERNWTNCSTSLLNDFIAESEESEGYSLKDNDSETVKVEDTECREALVKLMDVLTSNNYISDEDKDMVVDVMNGKNTVYSNEELDDMFGNRM